jgi:hypothetical protein
MGRKEAQGLLKRQTKEEEKKLWQAEKGQKARPQIINFNSVASGFFLHLSLFFKLLLIIFALEGMGEGGFFG